MYPKDNSESYLMNNCLSKYNTIFSQIDLKFIGLAKLFFVMNNMLKISWLIYHDTAFRRTWVVGKIQARF